MGSNALQVFLMQECTAVEPLAERENFFINRDTSRIIKRGFINIFNFYSMKSWAS